MKRLPSKKALRRMGIAAGVVASIVLAVVAVSQHVRAAAGEPSARLADHWHEGHRIVDREGRLLREIGSEAEQRGRPVALDQMGDRIVLATLVSEDKRFFEHDGVDGRAIARAIGQNLKGRRIVSGASTITQQLVKLLDAEGKSAPRTVERKVTEAARAQNLEEAVDKRTILEAYMNRLGYGHGLTGPEAAALGYFGVSAKDLSWAQAAWLAVLPRAPSFLDSYDHPERVRLRQRALLDDLREEGVMTEADHARAVDEPMHVRRSQRPFYAPHFVDAVVREVSRPGERGHGVTKTTLDLVLQEDAEGLLRTHLAALASLGAKNAAVIVVDNEHGEVLAWVGSGSYWDASIAGQVDMVRARRQPGSTLKPFVYALAFADGHSAAEPLADVPTRFSEQGGTYAPGNFDGTFEGPISAREALAGSLNVPAVRLAAEVGEGRLLESLQSLGFVSLDREARHYGLSLALGTGEVTLRELAGAYVALARGGERTPLRIVAGEEAAGEPSRVMDAAVASLVTESLSDPLARVRGLHGRGPFDLGFPVAVKTGTSSGHRDTWCVGYTHERTVAVWIGNADGAPTQKLTGASGAGPLFADVMRRAMENVPSRAPLWDEAHLESVEVCPLTGKLAGPACVDHASRHFIRGKTPKEPCDWHVRASTREGARGGEAPFACDSQGSRSIVVLPEAYEGFLAALPLGAPGRDPLGLPWLARSSVPGCGDVTHVEQALRIDGPAAGSVFVYGEEGDAQVIVLSASAVGGPVERRVSEVEFVVDGEVVGRSRWPFRTRYHAARGDHELVVRPADPRLAVRTAKTSFSVR
ncbi:penicillin-binding protein 1C [Polyangium sorediatum]|uniref:peptidoglycan glycosyltransferase n=1 Tax=Polyangium sorediatum TaxID=889274 RepID=A0ABT6NKX5_9BACT|nr:penicillin-binding protein 1C [Polyangium sorediatum]MDI1428976.1 penicillin-binding protein 1C [Polyangium sorediatum]